MFQVEASMDLAAQRESSPQAAAVLTRAVVRAAELLALKQKTLAATLGISAASVSRLARGRLIDPRSKEGELATVFLRMFRSLDAFLGGDEARAAAWMHAHNHHLGARPSKLIRTVTGLVHVTEYLDAFRGKS
jgi:DNA-directed RNA polymerase specialized sigma24 family protein